MTRRTPTSSSRSRFSGFLGFAAAALLALVPSLASAVVPDAISLGRFNAYDQDLNASAVRASGGFVLVTVSFPQVVSGATARLVKPDGSSVSLAASGDDFVYDSADYSSAAALSAAWPDGLYRIELGGTVSGTYEMRLSGTTAPTAPKITNLSQAQQIANGSGFQLQWEAMSTPAANDAILTSVLNESGTYRWLSPTTGTPGAVPASASAFTLPALPSDAELTGSVAFGRTAEEFTTNNGATTVSAGVASITYFPLRTGTGGAGSGVIAGEITIADGGGWRWSEWLGSYHRTSSTWPWLYHADHGWLYTHPDGSGGIFFWQPSLGWVWTKPSVYSYLYSYNRGAWVYYKPGSKNPRWFYDTTGAGSWFSLR